MWWLQLVNKVLERFEYEIVPIEYDEEEEELDETNHIICRECGAFVYYTPDNTIIYYWLEHPYYSVATTDCDQCDFRQTIFLHEKLEWELDWAARHELNFVIKKGYPPDNVVAGFQSMYPDYPIDHELTKHEVNEVMFLSYLLDHTEPEEFDD